MKLFATSPWACHLVIVVRLVCLHDPKSYAGGGIAPSRPFWIGRVGEAWQRTAPGPPGWEFGMGLITSSCKKLLITETRNYFRVSYTGSSSMTCHAPAQQYDGYGLKLEGSMYMDTVIGCLQIEGKNTVLECQNRIECRKVG